MNDQDQKLLSEIVECSLKGGWLRYTNGHRVSISKKTLMVHISYKTPRQGAGDCWGTPAYAGSLEKFILNGDAMKAALGESKVCPLCGGSRWDEISGEKICKLFCPAMMTSPPIPAYEYHSLAAAKLALTGKTSEAIKYLHDNMRGE